MEATLVGRPARFARSVRLDQVVGAWQASRMTGEDVVAAVRHEALPARLGLRSPRSRARVARCDHRVEILLTDPALTRARSVAYARRSQISAHAGRSLRPLCHLRQDWALVGGRPRERVARLGSDG